jgi:thioredoxin 1
LLAGFLVVSAASGASNKAKDLMKKAGEAYQAKDYDSTFKLFTQAAATGDSTAERLLGICYQMGVGVKVDPAEAFKWYMKSAKQKNTGGEISVAQAYETGTGVTKSVPDAIVWYKKIVATENDDTEKATNSLIRLGEIKKPYEIIGEDDFKAKVLDAKGAVLVEYFATWCGPCHLYGPIIEDIAKEYAGKLTVIRLDLDETPTLAKTYDIESIPQTFLFKDGKQVGRLEGYKEKDEVEKNIEEKLNIKKAS